MSATTKIQRNRFAAPAAAMLAAAVLALAAPAPALGDDHGPRSADASRGAALQGEVVAGVPFTGLDVLALGVVALSLTATGFVLRRLS